MLRWLEECEKLKALGKEWGEKCFYPDFDLRKGDYLKNFSPIFSSENNKDAYFFKWNIGNIGRYKLGCDEKSYFAVGDIWNAFLDKMESYNPVYNERYNCCMIFDIENGKRLERFRDEFEHYCRQLVGEYVGWPDIVEALKEEKGVDISIRWNERQKR